MRSSGCRTRVRLRNIWMIRTEHIPKQYSVLSTLRRDIMTVAAVKDGEDIHTLF